MPLKFSKISAIPSLKNNQHSINANYKVHGGEYMKHMMHMALRKNKNQLVLYIGLYDWLIKRDD